VSAFTSLLRTNRNYRRTWAGQVVSEVGDHFNNIAVMSLAMEHRNPGIVVTSVFLARGLAILMGGPIAGVLLDRMNRKHVMIASDIVRAVVALGFLLCIQNRSDWLLLVFSALLMFASPFFTSGRASILPSIATAEELHVANAMTQTTSWASLTVGAFLGAVGVSSGYRIAFLFNALSFVISALCISRLHVPAGFTAAGAHKHRDTAGWQQYREGLQYIRSTPLITGIALISVGWASGGGAAQILFSLFGEKVFKAGAMGIGMIWGFAGVGLLVGGATGYRLGRILTFRQYKRTIAVVYLIHGAAYVLFSQMPTIGWACVFIAISRGAVAVSSVLNTTQLLRHVEDQFRGRVFSTIESITWSVMMISMMGAGAASTAYDPRLIGAVAGTLSSTTAVFWAWANWYGKLPEPPLQTVRAEEEDEMSLP
jgi:MFS family permease